MLPLSISIPAKLTLFGEWAVLDGAPAIATTLGSRFVLEAEESYQPGIRFESGEHSFDWHDFDRPVRGFFELSANLVRKFHDSSPAHPWKNLVLRTQRSWRLEEGLGSSSATVAALAILAMMRQHTMQPVETLERDCIDYVRFVQKGRGSGLDIVTQLRGSQVLLEQGRVQSISLPRPAELMIVHTGQKISTQQAIHSKQLPQGLFTAIKESVEAFLKSRNWVNAIEQHHQALCEFGVVPEFIRSFMKQLQTEKICVAFKTIGAGGGDALLCWVEVDRQPQFRDRIEAQGWWINPYAWGAPGFQVHPDQKLISGQGDATAPYREVL